jgi:hypothetical protein
MPVVYAVMLASASATLPGDAPGLRRFQTPAVGTSLTLSQTFQVPVGGLQAIELVPGDDASGAEGDLRFDLYETFPRSSDVPVRSGTVPAAMVRPPAYRFEFAPIPDSKERSYRLDIVAPSGQGPAFWATKGDRYEGGAMYANGRERWADLSFRVDAPVPTIWGRLMMLRETNPVRAYLVIGALFALWIVVGLMLRAIETLPGLMASADPV